MNEFTLDMLYAAYDKALARHVEPDIIIVKEIEYKRLVSAEKYGNRVNELLSDTFRESVFKTRLHVKHPHLMESAIHIKWNAWVHRQADKEFPIPKR